MKGAFKLITIKGTVIGVHWTFIILLIWILQADTTIEDAAAQLAIHHHPYFLVISKDGLVGSVSRENIITAITSGMNQQPVSTLVKTGRKILNGEKKASEVWDELPAQSNTILPVVINGNLVGVANRDCIIDYLLLHNEKVNHAVPGTY
jgi:predicted transcriptional regulator